MRLRSMIWRLSKSKTLGCTKLSMKSVFCGILEWAEIGARWLFGVYKKCVGMVLAFADLFVRIFVHSYKKEGNILEVDEVVRLTASYYVGRVCSCWVFFVCVLKESFSQLPRSRKMFEGRVVWGEWVYQVWIIERCEHCVAFYRIIAV